MRSTSLDVLAASLRVEPHRRHPSRLRAGDIGVEPIADEPDVLGLDVQTRRRRLEQQHIRLSHRVVRRDQHERQMIGESVPGELVADDRLAEAGVADHRDRKSPAMKLLECVSGAGHRLRLY